MEVHPPEHPIHTPRDFFIHLLTITVGLLIALSLEGLVEVVHHRHLLHSAHHNLAIEIQSNARTLADDKNVLAESQGTITGDLEVLRAVRDHAGAPPEKFFFGWTWDGPTDSSWQSARDTGALALMDYDQVQRYSAVYTQQRLVSDAASAYINEDSHIGAPLTGGRTLTQLNPQEIDEMIHACSNTLIDINQLQSLMRTLESDYRHAEDSGTR